jgi:hypothetical protein
VVIGPQRSRGFGGFDDLFSGHVMIVRVGKSSQV